MAITFMDRLISDLKNLAKSLIDHINDPYIHKKSDVNNNIVTNTPIGSICWFNRTTAPDGWVVCDGKWYSEDGKQTSSTKTSTCIIPTPDLIGRYPLGATSNIGDTVEAGLPNITGEVTYTFGGGNSTSGKKTGAFYDIAGSQKGSEDDDYAWDAHPSWGFDASRSNPIYGNSTTVTPPSVRLLPCMKIYNADTDDFEAYVDHELDKQANNIQQQLDARPRIWSTTKTLSGDLNGQVLTITHTLGVAPKMVFAYISKGGTTELNAGTSASPITLFVFATVPLVNGTASTTHIDVLIPDITTSSSTVLTISALY